MYQCWIWQVCFRRQRATPEGRNVYVVVMSSLHVEPSSLSMQLLNLDTKERLQMELSGLRGNMVRLKINEVNPLSKRYEPPIGDVLVKEPEKDKWVTVLSWLYCLFQHLMTGSLWDFAFVYCVCSNLLWFLRLFSCAPSCACTVDSSLLWCGLSDCSHLSVVSVPVCI